MTDPKNEISLLVGREQPSKSHPGTQATPSDVAQGPGCPSYSGGGKDPPNTLTQSTLASPLDLTSLAEAIFEPAPPENSAWTLVAPRQRDSKRKGHRRTDRPTAKTHPTDRQTSVGKRGGKRNDPDCPTTSIGGTAGTSRGGRKGLSPIVDTATPSHTTDERGAGQSTASDRNPQASGESSHSTTRAGQSAATDRGTIGGHTDPTGNPILARGATGPCGSNTARPPTTTTTKTINNLPNNDLTTTPNPPDVRTNQRVRRRKRRGANPTTHITPQEPGTSSSSPQTTKRDRLDDTISPRGERKRPRTDQRQSRGATDSYAKAAQSHLCVAVTTTPRFELTQAEADAIQGHIQKAIFAACIEPLAPGQTRYAPAFEGKAFLGDGVLKMWCHDDKALSWLKQIITTITPPKSGTVLTVIRQADIPEKVRSGLFVPNYDGEIGLLHKILSHQNPWYGVSQWTLHSHQKTTGTPPGVFLILGIPKEEVPTVLERGRKVAYSTGSIYIRFFTAEGLSDVPSGHGSGQTGRQEPGAETAMDTDEPTDEDKNQTEPSIRTVLNNIEEVLLEAQVTNAIDTDNALAEPSEQRAAR